MSWPQTTSLRAGFYFARDPAFSRRVWIQPPADETRSAGLAVFLDGEYFATHIAAPSTLAFLALLAFANLVVTLLF